MKIHLVKSKEVSRELFTEVIGLLKAVPGPFIFLHDEDAVIDFKEDTFRKVVPDKKTFEHQDVFYSKSESLFDNYVFPLEREVLSWGALFEKCDSYRQKNKIPSNEMVLLLTEIANDSNWFSALDDENKFNGFIHVGDWDYFMPCRTAFPVAYEVVALALQHHMFDNYSQLDAFVHDHPIGCMNDMCINKKEIMLKLRTADICEDCMRFLRTKIPVLYIRQAMEIMEKLRLSMLYSQGFRQYKELSKITLDKDYSIKLPGYDDMIVKIGPLPKALYIFFLSHPEGIYLNDLHKYETEIYEIYMSLFPRNNKDQWKKSIEELVRPWLYNSCSEKLNSIRSEFKRLLSEDLAALYAINKAKDEKFKIAVLDKLAEQASS